MESKNEPPNVVQMRDKWVFFFYKNHINIDYRASTSDSHVKRKTQKTLDNRGCRYYLHCFLLVINSRLYSHEKSARQQIQQNATSEVPKSLSFLPHFPRDTHQVQKSHLHFLLHHLLNILPLNFVLHHPCHNLRGSHQDPPVGLQCHLGYIFLTTKFLCEK